MSTLGSYQITSSSPESAHAECRLILSVDDDSSILHSRFKLLSASGYAVLSTTDGASALQLFGRYPIDLVILNYMLPQIDGTMIAQAMKEYGPRVPIIMVSGLGVGQETLANVDRFLPNGQEAETLLGAVRE